MYLPDDEGRLTFDDVILFLDVLESARGTVELEVETGRGRLSLKRGAVSDDGSANIPGPSSDLTQSTSQSAPAPKAVASPSPASTPTSVGDADDATVTAPITGVFYRTPAPGEAPFVEVGSVVEADTIVGIIEVMKMMNTITAGMPGVVESIDVQQAQLVEHGQTLIRLKRS